MVLVTIVHVVSPCWKYCDCVVMVRVTLQDVRPRAIAAHVTKAVAIVTMILYKFCLFIVAVVFKFAAKVQQKTETTKFSPPSNTFESVLACQMNM